MVTQTTLNQLRSTLAERCPHPEGVRDLLFVSGLYLEGVGLEGPPDRAWKRALNVCLTQCPDALESLLVELEEKYPDISLLGDALKQNAERDSHRPDAEEGGGSLIQAVVRDPIEGTALLIEFAEAQGHRRALVAQLKRCESVLLEIARARQRMGQTLAKEARWRQALSEILEIASEIDQTGDAQDSPAPINE